MGAKNRWGSAGPPGTKMAGRFNRAAAISWPGTILSQEEMNTRPSKELQRTIISMLSAIRSRWGRMYFIGSKPQLVASQGGGRVELEGYAAGHEHALLHRFGDFIQMRVAGIDLRIGVNDADDRLAGDVAARVAQAAEDAAAGAGGEIFQLTAVQPNAAVQFHDPIRLSECDAGSEPAVLDVQAARDAPSLTSARILFSVSTMPSAFSSTSMMMSLGTTTTPS